MVKERMPIGARAIVALFGLVLMGGVAVAIAAEDADSPSQTDRTSQISEVDVPAEAGVPGSSETALESVMSQEADESSGVSQDEPNEPRGPRVIKGDCNGDGELSAVDLLMIRSYLVGKITLEGEKYLAADLSQDGTVSAIDLLMARQQFLETDMRIGKT